MKTLISREEIQRRVEEMGQEITRDYAGREPHLVGVLKGACTFLTDLGRAIELPITFDYIAVSADLTDRMLEYVGHLHEHFIDPVRVERGRFRLPDRPGFSSALRPEAISEYRFPDGAAWRT